MPDRPHSVLIEGTDVGVIGGLVVAVWFLILDLVARQPLLTPSLLGQVVLFGDSTPDRSVVLGAVLVYTAFHFLVFALVGMALVALVHWGIANPVIRYALLPMFLVFEVMFYGLLEVLSERTQELFPFWTVVGANTLAAIAMGVYLWRRHPAFRTSIRETPLGAAPLR